MRPNGESRAADQGILEGKPELRTPGLSPWLCPCPLVAAAPRCSRGASVSLTAGYAQQPGPCAGVGRACMGALCHTGQGPRLAGAGAGAGASPEGCGQCCWAWLRRGPSALGLPSSPPPSLPPSAGQLPRLPAHGFPALRRLKRSFITFQRAGAAGPAGWGATARPA